MEDNVYKLYTDGACRGNGTDASIAGAGAYIEGPKSNNIYITQYLGPGVTNNVAEYESLKLGLDQLIELNAKKVDIYMDSKLVCNQVNGVFKTKNLALSALKKQILMRLNEIDEWTLTYIPRDKNKIADGLANDAIDEFDGWNNNDYEVHFDGNESNRKFSTFDSALAYLTSTLSEDIVSIDKITKEYKIIRNEETVFERLVSW